MAPRRRKTAPTPAAAPEQLPPLGEPLAGAGEPLCVTAELAGAVAMPWGAIGIDSLLAWAVAARAGARAPIDGVRAIEIPVAREPGGRFHLASFSVCSIEEYELRWVNRRFPAAEAQMMAIESFKRINISAGAQKSYRLPLETCILRDDRMTWYLLGDRERVRELLGLVRHLGRRRGVGHGEVRGWAVEPCKRWKGFPVLRDGLPLRPLPADWPGLAPESDRAYRRLSYPYWLSGGESECAVPAREGR